MTRSPPEYHKIKRGDYVWIRDEYMKKDSFGVIHTTQKIEDEIRLWARWSRTPDQAEEQWQKIKDKKIKQLQRSNTSRLSYWCTSPIKIRTETLKELKARIALEIL